MIELYATLAVFIIILALMSWRPILAKISFRNFVRKRRQVAIAVCGLLVGTAIISSSMVIRDTMDYIFMRDVVQSLDLIDETVEIPFGVQGSHAPFDYKFYGSLAGNLSPDLVDGVSPVLLATVPVRMPDKGEARSAVQVIGLNFTIDRAFGPFTVDGQATFFEDMKDDSCVVNRRAADYMDVSTGDAIVLIGKANLTLSVKAVAENDGKADYGLDKNVFVTLSASQHLMNLSGQINMVKISNRGGVLDGAEISKEVKQQTEDILGNSTGMDDLGIYTFSEDGFQRNLLAFSTERFFDDRMLDALTHHPNITFKIDRYATYLYFPHVPGLFDFISVRAANGSMVPTPLTCEDFRNDAFGPYYTTDGRVMFTTNLKTVNGSFEVYITNTTAGLTKLKTGDATALVIKSGTTELTLPVLVKAVVFDYPGAGNGAFPPLFGGGVYIDRGALQELNASNIVRYQGSDARAIDASVRQALAWSITYASMGFSVGTVKQDGIDSARQFSETIGEVFLILGTFSVFAGIVLVVNIFVMLAEERKHDMGVERALGMRRSQLVQTYLFEGAMYAAVASLVGALLGVAIAWAVIYSFGVLFSAESIVMTPVVNAETLASAFAMGSLITIGTVAVASFRVSRLNIVRSIRDIPEPPLPEGSRLILVAGTLATVGGLLGLAYSLLEAESVGIAIAPCVVALGLAVMLMQRLDARVAFTVAGAFIIAWVVGPFATMLMDLVGAKASMELLVSAGMLMILGGILIVMSCSKQMIEALTRLMARRRSLRPMARISLSYPMNKRMRTANVLTMFSMVIFTITVISMISSLEADVVRTSVARLSGGYDLIVSFDQARAPQDLESRIRSDVPSFKFAEVAGLASVTTKIDVGDSVTLVYPVRGADHSFVRTNDYTFSEMLPEFKGPREVWDALETNSSLVVLDGMFSGGFEGFQSNGVRAHAGDNVTITSSIGQQSRLKVAAVMDELFIPGAFVSYGFLNYSYPGARLDSYFVTLEPGYPAADAGKRIEDAYVLEGASVLVIRDLVDQVLSISRSIMVLIQAYMGIGLVVGIAGLGVVTAREVVERRQEIGTLKAVGFTDGMIFKSFVIQISFITLLGISLGVSLGIALSWKLYDRYFTGLAAFSIPWLDLAVIVIIAFCATLASTLSPAYRASKIPPVDAIRYIE